MTQLLTEYCIMCFGKFFEGGAGPSHVELSRLFRKYGIADNFRWDDENKETKQQRIIRSFSKINPDRAKALAFTNALLALLRADGSIDTGSTTNEKNLRQALSESNLELSESYSLIEEGPIPEVDFESGGRQAIDEQLARLQKAQDDPALLIGIAKELLEAIAKFVLEESGMPVGKNQKFKALMYIAAERMNLRPKELNGDYPGEKFMRNIYQYVLKLCEEIDNLRNLQGTGHGRTLPTGVDPETARFVIKISALISQLLLEEWDKQRTASKVTS